MIRVAIAAVIAAASLSAADSARADAESDVRAQAVRAIAERLAVVERTDAALAATAARRQAYLEQRARSLYKLERAGHARRWVDGDERELAAWRRLISRRLIAREAREIDLLAREREAMVRARIELFRAIGQVAAVAIPARRSLARPVAGEVVADFGRVRDRDTGARLSRRGIEIEAVEGEAVRAVAAGEVIYAGPVRNVSAAAIVVHDDGTRSVLANLAELAVEAGAEVARGDVVGRSHTEPIYLEIRLPIGLEGFPLDPAPLLETPDSARVIQSP